MAGINGLVIFFVRLSKMDFSLFIIYLENYKHWSQTH